MNNLKIIFIGGLSNGKIILDYLQSNKYVHIPLIITYPKDHPVPRYVDITTNFNNVEVKNKIDSNVLYLIAKHEPDFIFVAGWSEILSKELISIPKLGTIGFHPSKLPNDRGRSVLAWQIEEGYTETGLTMFYYNEIPDCGDIIAQEKIPIEHNDYIGDVLKKVDDASYNLIRAYFPLMRLGIVIRSKQNLNEGNFRRLRKNRDSIINWDQNASVVYNKIRAISKPYPGAIGTIDACKYRIWRAEIVEDTDEILNIPPGRTLASSSGKTVVKCREKSLVIKECEKI